MGAEAQRYLRPDSPFEQMRRGREILLDEGEALIRLGRSLPQSFVDAVDRIVHARGSVIVSGMGKAGLIGQKLVATLGSLGVPSHFLHPAEAVHGDLGRIGNDDCLLLLSHSGETEEIVRLLPMLAERHLPIISITARETSSLGRASQVVLPLGTLNEACSLGAAPTTSTTAMLALGDALALVVSEVRGFTRHQFAKFHPGGSLGRRLSPVDEVMRSLDECRLATPDQSVRQVLVSTGKPGRRSGAVLLVDDEKHLVGIFTDSDLARLLEGRHDDALDRPVAEVMTRKPRIVRAGQLLEEALAIISGSKISELPVLDSEDHLIGLLDITDLVEASAG